MTDLEAFDAIVGDEAKAIGAGVLTHGAALRAVMGELKASGMPILDILKLIPEIVNLLITYGPLVMEIVQKVKELFAKK